MNKRTKLITLLRWTLLLPVTVIGGALSGALAAIILKLLTSRLFFFSTYLLPLFVQKIIVGVVSGAAIVIIGYNLSPRRNEKTRIFVVILGVIVSLLSTLGARLDSSNSLDIISNATIGITALCFLCVPIGSIPIIFKNKKN